MLKVRMFCCFFVILCMLVGCGSEDVREKKPRFLFSKEAPSMENDSSTGELAGGSGSQQTSSISYEDCRDGEVSDFRAALNAIIAGWSTYKSLLQTNEGITPSECLKNRILSTGKVTCRETDSICSEGLAGKALLLWPSVAICSNWLGNVQSSFSTSTKQVCYGALLMHEFSHSCGAIETRAEKIEDGTLAFLNSIHGTSLTNANCFLD